MHAPDLAAPDAGHPPPRPGRARSNPRAAVARLADQALRGEGVWPVIGGLALSRLLVWAGALWAITLWGVDVGASAPLDPSHAVQPFGASVANLLIAPAARYDTVWYLAIAHSGYALRQELAFFPLYPLLMSAAGAVLGSPLLAGVVVSAGALLAAVSGLYRLTRLELGEAAARTTVLLLLFFPTALFLSAAYTESLFLALTVGAILAARRERWALAGALGAFAAATRSSGVFLLVPLALMFLYGPRSAPPGRPADRPASRPVGRPAGRRGRARYRLTPSILWLGLIPAGLAAYLAYAAARYGSPLAPFRAEAYWERHFAGPLGGVWQAITGLPAALTHVLQGTQTPYAPGAPLGWQAYQLIDVGFVIFAAVGLWFCWRRLPFAYFAYACVLALQALSYPVPWEPLGSFSRYLLSMFPVFMGWGAVLAPRRTARRVSVAVLGMGLIVFSGLWGVWAWVA